MYFCFSCHPYDITQVCILNYGFKIQDIVVLTKNIVIFLFFFGPLSVLFWGEGDTERIIANSLQYNSGNFDIYL